MNPFADAPSQSAGAYGERALIEKIREWLGDASPPTPQGIGDDCAATPLPRNFNTLLTTADPVVYNRHFDDTISPEDVARKLLNRNISDIAAMGGSPRHATLSLAIPENLSINWLQRFFNRLSSEARDRDVQVNGGDTTATDGFLGAFLTLVGFANDRVLSRKNATTGSALFTTGALGGSRLGKHCQFEPRLAEGQWLATQTEVSSCMDISDGLGKDCAALVANEFSAEIDASRIPIADDAQKIARESGHSPLHHALNDGEDYELLFTLDPERDPDAFETQWRQTFSTALTRIGTIVSRQPKQPAILLQNSPPDINLSGYEHFRTT